MILNSWNYKPWDEPVYEDRNVKLLKWGLVFIIAFVFAWVVIFTFGQEPFKVPVPAKLLFWKTPSIPVYYYLMGLFAAGLLIGLCIAIYYRIMLFSKLSNKNKELRAANAEILRLKMDLEQSRLPVSDVPPSLQAGDENVSQEI
jgi:hypothetical protein